MVLTMDYWSMLFRDVDFDGWDQKKRFLRRIEEKLYEKVVQSSLDDPCDLCGIRLEDKGNAPHRVVGRQSH